MNKKALKQVWNYIKKYRIAMIITLVLAVAIVAMTLYVPIIIGNAIDNIVEAGDVNFVRIKDNIILVLILVALTAIFQWIMNT